MWGLIFLQSKKSKVKIKKFGVCVKPKAEHLKNEYRNDETSTFSNRTHK